MIKQTDEALEYENNQFEIEKFLPNVNVKSSKKKSQAKSQEVEEAEKEVEDEEEAEQEAGNNDQEDDEEIGEDEEDENMDMDGDENSFNWGAKDPRAGGVDVVLPQLCPDFAKVAEMLLTAASEKSVRNKNRQPIHRLVKR